VSLTSIIQTKTNFIMKYYTVLSPVFLLRLFCVFFLISCEEEQVVSESFNEQNILALEEIEDVLLEVSSVIDEVYVNEEATVEMKTAEKGNRYVPECAVKTVISSDGIKQVTIDFGDGCTGKNDKVFKGKLILTYEKDRTLKTKEITHTFENFYVNDKNISGFSSSIKEKSNANGNRQSTFTEDIAINWESGDFASRQGTRVSEMIEGDGDRVWSNNVYELSGSSISTLKNGTVHTVEITEKLRKELACRFIVIGTKEISKGSKSGVLDFGDGSCDAVATFTGMDGVVTQISLEKKKRK